MTGAFLRPSPWADNLLDDVNAASPGRIGTAAWQLGVTLLTHLLTLGLALVSLFLLLRYKVSLTWLIADEAMVDFRGIAMQ